MNLSAIKQNKISGGKKDRRNNVFEPSFYIESFLSQVKNDRTLESYRCDIGQFLEFHTDTNSISELTVKDLEVDSFEVEEFRVALASVMEAASINRKMSTLRNLYRYLEKHYPDNKYIRETMFNLPALPVDVKHYGSLSVDEIDRLCDFTLKERNKSWEKHYLIKLAQRTSFRSSVLLNLEWSDIQKDEFRDDVYIVTGRNGKRGKTHTRPIHKDFYDELLTLKEKYEYEYDDDKIFHLNKMDTSRLMNRFCKAENISEKRNIAFHSIRRFGSNFIKRITGDITLAQEQLDHSDIRTTMIYTDTNDNIDLSVGMILDSDFSGFNADEMTADEWKKLFQRCSKEVQTSFMLKAKNVL